MPLLFGENVHVTYSPNTQYLHGSFKELMGTWLPSIIQPQQQQQSYNSSSIRRTVSIL